MRTKILLLIGAFLLAAGSVHAAPFAMVTQLNGDASVLEGGKSRKLALLGYLENPAEIKVENAAKLSITYFASGVQYDFSGPSRVAIDSAAPRVIEGAVAKSSKVTPEKSLGGELSSDQWRRLQQATVVMRGSKSAFTAVSPDNTVVLDSQPEFEWTAAPGAKAYHFVLYGTNNAVLHEATVNQTVLRPIPVPLEWGQRYHWQVEAEGAAKPVRAQANFALAEPQTRERLLAIRPAPGATLGARVFYATLLAAQGHSYDARLEWKQLAKEYPNEPEIISRAK